MHDYTKCKEFKFGHDRIDNLKLGLCKIGINCNHLKNKDLKGLGYKDSEECPKDVIPIEGEILDIGVDKDTGDCQVIRFRSKFGTKYELYANGAEQSWKQNLQGFKSTLKK